MCDAFGMVVSLKRPMKTCESLSQSFYGESPQDPNSETIPTISLNRALD
jgi:hypothetical protein